MEIGTRIFALMITFGIGLAIGKDAAKRGMNEWFWTVSVALLLIVFLPLYYIVRKPLIKDNENKE
jgi:hypothetical protein